MGLFVLQLVNGITNGMLYGLAALGLAMVYKSLGYLNFAHSDTIMLGAILYTVLIKALSIPVWAAFFSTLAVVTGYGILTEKCLFFRLRKTSAITFMLFSMSLSTVVKNVVTLLYGAETTSLDVKLTSSQFYVDGIAVSFNNIIVFLIALIILAVLTIFFNMTKFGLAIRLACEDPDTASLMGVNILNTRTATFGISAALGCIAGMLIGPIFSVSVELGSQLILKSFIAAVIGGLGNFVGAVVGGIIVGVVESLGTSYISSTYKDLIVYLVGIIVLAFFPMGIFKRKATNKH